MRRARPAARRDRDLCSGPAKLCQALGIDRDLRRCRPADRRPRRDRSSTTACRRRPRPGVSAADRPPRRRRLAVALVRARRSERVAALSVAALDENETLVPIRAAAGDHPALRPSTGPRRRGRAPCRAGRRRSPEARSSTARPVLAFVAAHPDALERRCRRGPSHRVGARRRLGRAPHAADAAPQARALVPARWPRRRRRQPGPRRPAGGDRGDRHRPACGVVGAGDRHRRPPGRPAGRGAAPPPRRPLPGRRAARRGRGGERRVACAALGRPRPTSTASAPTPSTRRLVRRGLDVARLVPPRPATIGRRRPSEPVSRRRRARRRTGMSLMSAKFVIARSTGVAGLVRRRAGAGRRGSLRSRRGVVPAVAEVGAPVADPARRAGRASSPVPGRVGLDAVDQPVEDRRGLVDHGGPGRGRRACRRPRAGRRSPSPRALQRGVGRSRRARDRPPGPGSSRLGAPDRIQIQNPTSASTVTTASTRPTVHVRAHRAERRRRGVGGVDVVTATASSLPSAGVPVCPTGRRAGPGRRAGTAEHGAR